MASKNNSDSDNEEDKKPEPEPEPLFIESRWKYREEPRRMDSIEVVVIEEAHKKVIRDTWPLMSESLEENGVKLYMKIFEVSPKIRAIFKLDEVETADLMSNETLHLHAKRFMLAIESAVTNIDDIEGSVKPIFINLGKHHIYFKGINKDYFSVFSGAMMYVWKQSLGDKFTAGVRTAWSRLFDLLLQHLNFGYQLALKDKS